MWQQRQSAYPYPIPNHRSSHDERYICHKLYGGFAHSQRIGLRGKVGTIPEGRQLVQDYVRYQS